MVIDPTISIGNIIEAVGFVGGVGIIIIRQGMNSQFMKNEIKDMKDEIKELATVVTKMAVADNRLTNLEKDIRDLRRGHGFIVENINGEYLSSGKVTP